MTTPLSRQRSQIAIPAQGMIEIRDALTDLLNEFGTEDQGLMESNYLLLHVLFILLVLLLLYQTCVVRNIQNF